MTQIQKDDVKFMCLQVNMKKSQYEDKSIRRQVNMKTNQYEDMSIQKQINMKTAKPPCLEHAGAHYVSCQYEDK